MNKNNKMNKTPKGGTDRNAVSGATQSKPNTVKQIHTEKEKVMPTHKIAPTAEQLRIAQMIDNTHSEKQLQEKINQVTQVTGVSTDDAMIALHDCNHDVSAAIDALLEGENQGEWKESTKKKKKASTKGKEEKDDNESNKENCRNDNREQGGSKAAPRFRGRGGRGAGPRDETGDGFGRGSMRKGKMVNGSSGSYRGRGSRGRGSNYRTFQTKQPLGFTETIDTWGEPPVEKVDDVSSLQIDTWGEEPVATTEEWGEGDGEWTGSLEHTTIFGPSTSSTSPVPSSSICASDNSPKSVPGLSDDQPSNTLTRNDQPVSMGNGSHPESMNILMGQRTPSEKLSPVKGTNTFGPSSETMRLASLLQKATPHSTLERISAPTPNDNSSLGRSKLNSNPQNSILSNLASSVEDSLKTVYASGGPNAAQNSVKSKPYSSENSIFAHPNVRSSNLTSINENAISKALGLVSQGQHVTRTNKQPSRKIPTTIPLSAVEMPEDAMAALDIQMAGLEFGAEAAFDFSSEAKTNVVNSMATGGSSRDLGGGPGINPPIQQTQTSLGPEPIPFPTQGGERKTSGGPLLTNQRAPSASQSFAELKKDNPNSLSGLVGSTPTAPSPYQSSSSYNSKPTSTSFPSPPSTHFAQSQSQTYSGNSASGVGNNYPGSISSNKVSSSTMNNQAGVTSFSSSFPSHTNATSPYQTNYASSSSHSNLSSINVPGLKEQSQQIQNYSEASVTSLPGSISTNASSSVPSNNGPNTLASLSASAGSVQSKQSASGKPMGGVVPPGVTHLSNHSQQIMHHALSQAPHHQLQQQIGPQQQTQLVTGHGPSQYVTPPAALPGAIPPAYYNVQQPAMYSYEDLQMFQRGIPHLAPTSLPGARDGPITSPAAYSAPDVAKFRTDQNSSPVPSTISQQPATAGGTYITAAGNGGMHPFYMYHNMAAVPNTFPQYGHPTIIQLPPNSHTGSTTTQFPGPPKIPYGGTSNYYDSMSQSQEYKSGYGSASQGQNKTGNNSAGTASNPGTDLSGYKNHFSKVGRNYDKQGFHSGTPPPFNMTGSGSNPMTANAYGPAMFFSTVPAGQHHSPLMHHQIHQDGTNASNQRGGIGGSQNKAASKPGYSGSYWGPN